MMRVHDMTSLPGKPRWAFVWVSVVAAGAAATGVGLAASEKLTLPITVINYSALPVHATAIALDEQAICSKLGLPAGTPLRVRTGDKASNISLNRGSEDGRPIVWLYVSLPPSSRLDLVAEGAERWPDGPALETKPDALRNGVVRVTFEKKGWKFGFDADQATRVGTMAAKPGDISDPGLVMVVEDLTKFIPKPPMKPGKIQ